MLANNLWTINDMPLGKTGTAVYGTAVEAALPGQGSYPPLADPVKPHVGTDNYMANSMVNYQLSCRDNWFDLQTYTIHLNFVEEDSASGAGSVQNHFFTWKDLP